MTTSQSQAVWELCRQGLHMSADRAERCWQSGVPYRPDFHAEIPRGVKMLIERSNREAQFYADRV
jgi:hypothetical protein